MNRRKRKTTTRHSDSLNEDDGIDPRYYFASDRREGRNHRKAFQLCRQVADTLHYVLHGTGDNEVLSSLMVMQVLPAPDTARLLVIVQSDLPTDQVKPDEIIALLDSQTGRLRTEIASSINRKKTPQLIFQVVMASELPDKK